MADSSVASYACANLHTDDWVSRERSLTSKTALLTPNQYQCDRLLSNNHVHQSRHHGKPEPARYGHLQCGRTLRKPAFHPLRLGSRRSKEATDLRRHRYQHCPNLRSCHRLQGQGGFRQQWSLNRRRLLPVLRHRDLFVELWAW
jgi:hypothetical protein